jgi:hypothetical protein
MSAAIVVMIGATFAIGDPLRGASIIVSEAAHNYRFIWARRYAELYFVFWNGAKLNYIFVTLLATTPLIALRIVPLRVLAPAGLMIGGLVTFFGQQKGFPYHLHGALAGTHLTWLAILAWVVRAQRRRWWLGASGIAFVVAMTVFYATSSESFDKKWSTIGRTREMRESSEYYAKFPTNDFFAMDMRNAASFVRERTAADARVQTWGMDPYFLFLAERRSASSFIYSFELDVDAAIIGGSGAQPSPEDVEWLHSTARAHEDRMLAELESRRPAAFVFFDRMPFSFPTEAVANFSEHCPRAYAWMIERYAPAEHFHHVHVWLAK